MQVIHRQVGTTTRLRVLVDGEARFIKRPSTILRARVITELAGITEAEVRFYLDLAEEVPVRVPRAISARHRPWTFELVIEDLVGSGCTLLRPGAALEVEQAEQVLLALAALHGAYWEDPRLDHELRWLTDVHRREVMLGQRFARPLMAVGLLRAGPLVPAALRAPARRYAAERARVSARLSRGPRTVIHHDCHPGNLFWTADGDAGLLDWQLARCGSWASDVAYLLATGLSTEDRRTHADALLDTYLGALPPSVRPEPDEAKHEVRAHTAYAFEAMILTLAVGGLMERNDIRRLVHRTALAVADSASFELLRL